MFKRTGLLSADVLSTLQHFFYQTTNFLADLEKSSRIQRTLDPAVDILNSILGTAYHSIEDFSSNELSNAILRLDKKNTSCAEDLLIDKQGEC